MASSNDLVLEAWLEDQDPRWLSALRTCQDDRVLAKLAGVIISDTRPWTRQQLLAYLAEPMHCPGHHPLVKRIFKHAEAHAAHDLMAGFLVAFDRLVRRTLVTKRRWNVDDGGMVESETLHIPRNSLLPKHLPKQAKGAGKPSASSQASGGLLFSLPTRLYLRRRAWRYFRNLGFRDRHAYRVAITPALASYADTDLGTGHDLLECWGLLHALFGKSPVIRWGGTWAELAEDRSLHELAPAPAFADTWQTPEAYAELWQLATAAQAALVRKWAQDMVRTAHGSTLNATEGSAIRQMLRSPWPDVRQFGISILESGPEAARFTTDMWLDLLQVDDAELLQRLTVLMQKHVQVSRLSPVQLVRLACHRSAVVCQLAMTWMEAITWSGEAPQAALAGMQAVTCAALAERLGALYLRLRLGESGHDIESLLLCLDHRLLGMRRAGCQWVEAHPAALHDTLLWSRIAETPYVDVRAWMTTIMERFASIQVDPSLQFMVWTSVLLGVSQGSRAKRSVLRQITDLLSSSDTADTQLLPLLRIALRSLSDSEQLAALAAIVRACVSRPSLVPQVQQFLPELDTTALTVESP